MARGLPQIFTAISLSSRGNLVASPTPAKKLPSTRLDHPSDESKQGKIFAAVPYHPLSFLCSLFYTSLPAIRSGNGQPLPIGKGLLCPSTSEFHRKSPWSPFLHPPKARSIRLHFCISPCPTMREERIIRRAPPCRSCRDGRRNPLALP